MALLHYINMILVASMWDDGLVTDLKLIEILQKLGGTAAFAISPSKHKISRVVNDIRGPYGKLVAYSELKEFEGFEVCNHTDNHFDLGKLKENETRREIVNGRKHLEDIYNSAIHGFCYPYGVYTPAALKVLASEGTSYARTTAKGPWGNKLLLHPTSKWNNINMESERIVFWGHTYELSNKDWDWIKELYKTFIDNPKYKLVTFEDIIK